MSSIADVEIERAYVRVPDGVVHYRKAGSGPPLLLLHPSTYSSVVFLDVIPYLAQRYTVIAPDRLGHGNSDPIPDHFEIRHDFSLPDELRYDGLFPYKDLLRVETSFLDALGVDRLSVVGWSTGAHIAIELSLAQPDRIDKLVLPAIADWETDELRRSIVRGLTESQLTPQMDGSHLKVVWDRKLVWASPYTTPEIMHKVGMQSLQSTVGWSRLVPAIILHYHASDRLQDVTHPTLFLDGELDAVQGRHAHRQAALLPSSTPREIAVVKNAGYLTAYEQPAAFAQPILDFLAVS